MKEELNIAAILKDKPCNLKLYDVAREINVFYGCQVGDDCEIHCNLDEGGILAYNNNGTLIGFTKGMQILKPSKQMRNWGKFAWKKGDVLYTGVDSLCIFDKWVNDEYTKFYGKFATKYYCKDNITLDTKDWTKAGDDTKEIFIKRIEEFHNGKLNLSTLQIDKQQEFKDGDIVFSDCNYRYNKSIFIIKRIENGNIYYSPSITFYKDHYGDIDFKEYKCFINEALRLATNSEKQQLFDALAKENKRWNPDTLQIEDLPKKCEFKPMEWCLMKRNTCRWELCQYSFFDGSNYHCAGGALFHKCIPYNDQTKHLLGTTDDWKGGEG